VSIKRARIGQVMMEFVGLRIDRRQMRQAVLVVKQSGPVKSFLAEFGSKF
jgi:hypothetical protein